MTRVCQEIVAGLADAELRQAILEISAWESVYATPHDGGQLLRIGRLFAGRAGVSTDLEAYTAEAQSRMPDWRRMVCVRWAEDYIIKEAALRFAKVAAR